jgi:hypothetical protein
LHNTNAQHSGEHRLARLRGRCCEVSSDRAVAARGCSKLGDGKVVLTGGSHRWRSERGTRWEQRRAQSKMRRGEGKGEICYDDGGSAGYIDGAKTVGRVHVGEKVGSGQSETVGATMVCEW